MAGILPASVTPARGSAGKRGPSGPIVTTSDEDESCPADDLPRIATSTTSVPKTADNQVVVSTVSPGHSSDRETADTADIDAYECVSSPGDSSTASGPIFVRPPGFTHRAQEVTWPRVKKKKTASVLLHMREVSQQAQCNTVRGRPKKDPLPMKLRALPQSFFQQPNVPNHVPPGTLFPTLPPLCTRETDEDVSALRPISPTSDESTKEKTSKKPSRYMTEWKITQADSDSLFRLFDKVSMEKPRAYVSQNHMTHRRYRPRRQLQQSSIPGLLLGDDPNMMDAVSEKLLPQLSIERHKQLNVGHTSLQLITFKEGDKSIMLPTLAIEQNYSQMLSELVMNI